MTVPYTFGHDPNAFFLSNAQVSFQYAIIAQPLWAWSMATIKISFALMLLRIEQASTWRRFLWAMIIVQIVVAVFNTLGIFLQCIPFEKSWDLLGVVPGSCWSKRAQSISTIVVSTINIITDFVFAGLPIGFLRKVQRPIRERLVVGILMGLGVFAGVASIIKITAASQFGRTGDTINESVMIGMWSVIEEQIGLIAISVPCLRSPVQRVLHTFGDLRTRIRHYGKSRHYGRAYEPKEDSRDNQKGRNHLSTAIDRGSDVGLKQGSQRTERSADEMEMDSPIKRPCEIWCTKEVMVDHDNLNQIPTNEWPSGGPQAVWTDHDFSRRDVEMGRAI
jgi:hypothetical protein